jgi:3-phenylpropionate/trans-cinnamate dioxygenase ferredoxin reductase subunit
MQQAGVVIIGGGLAGAQVAIQLRQRKYAGPVTLLSAEAHAPYWRPPLSKSILEGTEAPQSAALRPLEFWDRRRIDLRLGAAARALDRLRKTVTANTGEVFGYDQAVLATGAQCIIPPLPGIDLPRVHVLRTLDDALVLREAAGEGVRIAILGGGFIGLTVVEREPRLLARVASPEMSDAVLALHRARGVTVLLGRGATAIVGAGAAADALQLDDGQTIMFDHLLVCVGIRPDTSLAMQAGLDIQDGILVNEHLRSSDPAIFALGDCARFPSRRYGRMLRLESIQHAIDGAAAVAAAICGESPGYDPLPIISSLQFGHQLDFIGLASASCVSRRFQTDDDSALLVLREEAGRCVAVECLDAPPETIKMLRSRISGAEYLANQ